MNTLREIIADHIEYRRQLFRLAKSDIIKTYSGTMLGWLWALLKPGIYLGIYYFVFTVGVRVGKPVGEYSYFMWLLAGLIPWFYIRNIFVAGAGSIRKYRYMVTKIKFPVSTIPTVENLSNIFINLVLQFIMLMYFVVAGKGPDAYWLQLPLYWCAMIIFFNWWSLFAGLLSTMSKDFLQLIKSVTIALFWISGVIFDVGNIGIPIVEKILMINPVTFIINGFRDCLVYKRWFWEDLSSLLMFVIVFVLMNVLALFVYKKTRKDIPDML